MNSQRNELWNPVDMRPIYEVSMHCDVFLLSLAQLWKRIYVVRRIYRGVQRGFYQFFTQSERSDLQMPEKYTVEEKGVERKCLIGKRNICPKLRDSESYKGKEWKKGDAFWALGLHSRSRSRILGRHGITSGKKQSIQNEIPHQQQIHC